MQNAGEQIRDPLMLPNERSKGGNKQVRRDWLCIGNSVCDADGLFLISLCASRRFCSRAIFQVRIGKFR